MKSKTKITSIIALILCFVLAMFTGCGNKKSNTDGNNDGNGGNSSWDEGAGNVTSGSENAKYAYTGSSGRKFQFKTFLGVPGKMPVYNAVETSFYLKTLTDEEFENYYKELKDAGFTVLDGPYTPEGEEHNVRMLAAAEKYGLKQLVGEVVNSDGISLSLMLRGTTNDPQNKAYADYTDAEIKTLLEEFMEPYLQYESFYGFSYWDEPSSVHFAQIERMRSIFEEVAPGKILYVNLLPIYDSVTPESMGYETMEERLQYPTDYVDTVKTSYISYDRYPLVINQSGDKETVEDFLYNMQLYRQAADKDGRELWTYLQSTGHTTSSGATVYADPDSIADFRWQVNSFLAFGGSSITWFTAFPPPPVDGAGTQFTTGIYDRKGRKTDRYYYIKAVQEEVHAFEDVYLNFKWKNLMTIVGEDNDIGRNDAFRYLDKDFAIDTHERISAHYCQQDTLIGCFEDSEGNDGFMVTNYADPALKKSSKTSITFNDAEAVAVYRLGEKRIIELGSNKTVYITLLPGEGMFVIPLK